MRVLKLRTVGLVAWTASISAGCESNARRTPYADNPLIQARQPISTPQTAGAGIAKTHPREAPQVVEIPKSSITRPPIELASSGPQPIALLPPPLAPIVGPVPTLSSIGEQSSAPPSNRMIEGRYGHSTDHSWLQGELDRQYRGHFELRFRPESVEDVFGGKVRLETHPDLEQFQVGDRVAVEGDLLPEGEGSNGVPAPAYRQYRVRSIRLIQRP